MTPTESAADKVSSFQKGAIVRCNALDDPTPRTLPGDCPLQSVIGLDYFDASINRIGAYVIGTRAAQKCMLRALLEPLAKLREYEAAGQGFPASCPVGRS